ncbi:unnamed protein product, partial [Allacma fusca]
LSRWQLSQRITQHFWKRWASEYLTRLQHRPKWATAEANMQIGDLVLVKEEMRTPLQWKMGRIIDVHPGGDGLVRVATIRMADGSLKRPITKLCLLPLDRPPGESGSE